MAIATATETSFADEGRDGTRPSELHLRGRSCRLALPPTSNAYREEARPIKSAG